MNKNYNGISMMLKQHRFQTQKRHTHLSVSVADGLGEWTPSLSVFHLHWCIMGQQEMGTF